MPTLIRRARAGLPLEMVSPDTARDFVLRDVVDALVEFPRLLGVRGEVVNLAAARETTLREVVATVTDLLGSRSEVRWGAMAARQLGHESLVRGPGTGGAPAGVDGAAFAAARAGANGRVDEKGGRRLWSVRTRAAG